MTETNEPAEQRPSAEVGAPSAIRLAVFEVAGEEKTHVGTITLSKDDGSDWTAQAARFSDSALARIRSAIERFAESRRASVGSEAAHSRAAPPDWHTLADMLTEDGFTVEELPAGDYQINIQMDLSNRIVVGMRLCRRTIR
jgi:hypothetical protein